MAVRMTSAPLAAAGICALAASLAAVPARQTSLDLVFQQFFDARTPEAVASAASKVLAAKVPIADALKRLKAGPVYSPQPTGRRHLTRRADDGTIYHYWIDVPAGYTPSRKIPVRIVLHGGIDARSRDVDPGDAGVPDSADEIVVTPAAWPEAPWWSSAQLANLRAILDGLRRDYNVDENRIALMGVSDGGTGAYFVAMRDSTQYAAFLPFNGFLPVLGNQGYTLNDRIFPNNLKNKPFFVVNGGRDPLYPASAAQQYIDEMLGNRVAVEYHPQSEAGHETSWWPQLKGDVRRFLAAHPRDPLPDTVSWEIEEEGPYNRAQWLIIDRLMAQPDADLPVTDVDRFRRRSAGAGSSLFAYRAPAGRVDVVRTGNTVEATTSGVSAFTLLLSPDEIDFRKPVRFVLNGQVTFDGRMEPSLAMLLKWAGQDRDRTMLFVAELHVTVESPP